MSVTVTHTMEKINTHKCLTSVFLIFFAHFYTVASDVVEKPMIIDSINYCHKLNILQNSSYLAKCSEIPFPSEFKENNIDLALCMMIFDTMNKICQNIINNDYKVKLPETVKELDNDIRKYEPKPKDYDNFIANICKKIITIFESWNGPGVQSDSRAVIYVKYVAETLFEQQECRHTCHKPKNIVNPLCTIFLWFNELLRTVKMSKSKSISNTNLENSAPVSESETQKESSTLENLKNVNSSNFSKNKQQKFEKLEENTSLINNISTKQTLAQSLPLNSSKASDAPKMKHADDSSVHNEHGSKKDSEYKIDDRRKDELTLSLSINDKGSTKTYKSSEIFIDNPNNILQQEEVNPDKELMSNENNLNKKINENKDEDSDEHDNINDFKESISNSETELLSRNAGLFENGKKIYPHSSLVKEEDETHFFTYFSIITLTCIGLYIGYHNKQKILAMVLEGRRSRRSRSSRRRPSTASYHKLDCNLEEAVTSQCNSNVTHVIY